MKKKLFLVLIIQYSSFIFARDADLKFFSEENKSLIEYKNEKDPSKKEALAQSFADKCPFKNESSEVGSLIPNANALALSSNIPEAKRAECAKALAKFNEDTANARKLQGMATDTNIELSSETKTSLQNNLSNIIAAKSGLSEMLSMNCQFDNSTSEVANIANNLNRALEGASTAVSYANPLFGLVGMGVAAAGRMFVNFGEWIFGTPKNQLTEEAKESEKFISELCSFRKLAMNYDKLYFDPFEDKIKEKTPVWKKKEREIELKKKLECTDQLKSNLDKLKGLSKDLASIAEKSSSQKQCLEMLNRYTDDKNDSNKKSLLYLSQKYGCPTPEGENAELYLSFCKNYSAIDALSEGDIYEKCDKEDLQKMVNLKSTNLSDILLKTINRDLKTLGPDLDELQKIRQQESNEKEEFNRTNGLKVVMDLNVAANLNAEKALIDSGRSVLGIKFDHFSESSLEGTERDLDEATSVLDDLLRKKKNLEEGGLFSSPEKDKMKKSKVQLEICQGARQVRRQLGNAYRSVAGLKDVCDFMIGDGVPPLKASGFNYDSYAADTSDQENNLTNKCKDLGEDIADYFSGIKEQLENSKKLECDK